MNTKQFKWVTGSMKQQNHSSKYEGWNFNSDNYLFTTDTK